MNKEKLGQEPAFANGSKNLFDENGILNGMSKRFYAACDAMQGLIMNFPKERMVNDGYIANSDYPELIKEAYELADELLKQENEWVILKT